MGPRSEVTAAENVLVRVGTISATAYFSRCDGCLVATQDPARAQDSDARGKPAESIDRQQDSGQEAAKERQSFVTAS